MNPSIALLDEALAKSKKKSPRIPIEQNIKQRATAHVRALSTVINFIITDAFNLDAEESMWLGYNLNQVLDPLTSLLPSSILVAVEQELKSEEYSNRLMVLLSDPNRDTTKVTKKTPGVKYASLGAWVDGISEIILGSYPGVRPMYKSRIVGSVYGLFQELGVTANAKTSRASAYLPTSVRFILAAAEMD